MIVLWREPENTHRATVVALHVGLVRVAEQTRDRELTALDPQPCRLAHGVERHDSAVAPAHEAVGVVRLLHGSRTGLELVVEELVECF